MTSRGRPCFAARSPWRIRARWIMQLSPRGSHDDGQPLLEARVVKDSYHVPHEPVIFERCTGGALREVAKHDVTPGRICEALTAWLLAHPDAIVCAGSIRYRRGSGLDAYTSIVRQIPSATPATIYEAARWGIVQDLFAEEFTTDARRRRKVRLVPTAQRAASGDPREI